MPTCQPQGSPSVSADHQATSAPESSTRPGTSTREGDLIGDSGTKRWTRRPRRATGIDPKMKSQRHDRWSTISAGEDDPDAAADAEDRRDHPDPDLHLVGRKLVADDREAEREQRAAEPRTSTEADQRPDAPGAAAAPMQPTRKTTRLTTSSRSLPYWSPSRPSTGVVTAAETRGSRSAPRSSTPCVVPSSRWRSAAQGTPSSAGGRTRAGEREDRQGEVVILARSPGLHLSSLA